MKDPHFYRTWIDTENGSMDIATADTTLLYNLHNKFSMVMVHANDRLNGPEAGKGAVNDIELNPYLRVALQRGVTDIFFDLRNIEQELLKRPDGRELLFPGIRKADEGNNLRKSKWKWP